MRHTLRKKKSPFGKPSSTVNRYIRNQKKTAKSSINPELLVKEARPVEIKGYVSERTIESLPIDEKLKDTLLKKGFTRPTEIQDKTIEHLLAGKDLLGIAQTGTGKTGAFLIPIIHKLLTGEPFQTLVLVPTRELAVQVEEEFRSMTKGLNLFSACFIGGTNINKDLGKLRRTSHVVIGTPGRLLDLNQRRVLDFKKFDVLILDEFDRMLDMGFLPDVQRITGSMQGRKQTLLFSATVDRSQQQMINELLRQPVEVKVSSGEVTGDHIEQNVIRVSETENKFQVLVDMLRNEEFKKVLVFSETKRGVHKLCAQLKKANIKVDEIHGDKTQSSRQKALDMFKKGFVQVLVATDVAARGLDVSDVTHVINYQIPANFDSYIHRIGRTGRAGKGGKAYTFLS